MKSAMVRHDEILEKTIATHRGYIFARMGDGMAAAFATARDAVSAAAALEQALAAEHGVPHGHCGQGSDCTPTKRSSSTTPGMPACPSIGVPG